MYIIDYIKTLYTCLYVIRPRTREMRWRLWPRLLRRTSSLLSRLFWTPLKQPTSAFTGRQLQPPSISTGWSFAAPPTPPPRRLWRWQSSTPLPMQYYQRHLRTANYQKSEAIWNVKTKSEVLTIYQTTSEMILFSDYQLEMFFFNIVSMEWISRNLKKSEIWRRNLRFFVPIWNQSETSLKPIWKCTTMEYFHIDNLK